MNDYFELIIRFNHSPTLCNFLQLLAHDVWKRIEFARTRKGLKIFETTITQNILYELRVYCELYPSIPIQMFESFDESRNGNDIEFLFQTSEGFINFPVQSKIIYKNDEYVSMDHRNQLNDLIAYANSIGGIPLYLLYNYFSDTNFTHNENLCGINYSKEQFGCSLISAHYLRDNYAMKRIRKNGNPKWRIPGFTDLHPSVAVPWFLIGCCRNNSTNVEQTINLITNNLTSVNKEIKQRIKIYNYEELINDYLWQPLKLKGNYLNEHNDTASQYNGKFLPKYRLIFLIDDFVIKKY